jgi:hypothetical protein
MPIWFMMLFRSPEKRWVEVQKIEVKDGDLFACLLHPELIDATDTADPDETQA